MGAVLAVDFGTRRIGLAVTDPGRSFVFTRPTLERTSPEADLEAIARQAAADGADTIAVGLPLNVDGSEGPMARAARQLGEDLRARTGLRVEFVDERYSSLEADEKLRKAHPRDTRKRRRRRDQVAAAVILRTWLEHGPHP